MSLFSNWACTALIVLAGSPMAAQSPGTQEALLARQWTLAYYEEAGERIPPSPDQRNDVMDIHADHTLVSIESGATQHGTWSYDAGRKELVVVDNQTKERMVLHVVTLGVQECILEFKDPDGVVLRMHMVPR